MNRQETLDCLDREGIGYELTEHKAVYNMAELAEVDLPYPHLDAKNLFVRDDKRLNYYLITVRGEKRVNLKDFRRQHSHPSADLRLGGGTAGAAGAHPRRCDSAGPAARYRLPGPLLSGPGFPGRAGDHRDSPQ